jgi:hypothetical protein
MGLRIVAVGALAGLGIGAALGLATAATSPRRSAAIPSEPYVALH